MSNNKNIPNSENPETLLNLRLTKTSDYAAGITGVGVAVRHVFREMAHEGLLPGLKKSSW